MQNILINECMKMMAQNQINNSRYIHEVQMLVGNISRSHIRKELIHIYCCSDRSLILLPCHFDTKIQLFMIHFANVQIYTESG